MPVRAIRAIEITCDEPGCDADFLTDPPVEAAIERARAAGWAVIAHRLTRCPIHRRYRKREAAR